MQQENYHAGGGKTTPMRVLMEEEGAEHDTVIFVSGAMCFSGTENI